VKFLLESVLGFNTIVTDERFDGITLVLWVGSERTLHSLLVGIGGLKGVFMFHDVEDGLMWLFFLE
jgi:hypothetical protein